MFILGAAVAAAVALADATPAGERRCGPIQAPPAGDAITRQATALFLQRTEKKILTYDVKHRDCESDVYVFFVGTGKFESIGQHWLVVYRKASRTYEFMPGQ